MPQEKSSRPQTFEQRIRSVLEALSPTERRVAQFFIDHKEVAVLNSAGQIAARIGTSDATVVRAVQSLGFESLASLREALLGEITRTAAPRSRLRRTLGATDGEGNSALDYVIAAQERVLDVLRDEEFQERFNGSLKILAQANRRYVFGIGPSGAIADYASLQFNRIGYPSTALSTSGIGLADCLLEVAPGDAVLLIAYAPLYREVVATLEHCERLYVPVVLVSDTLGPHVQDRVKEVLPVPRGRSAHLSLHAGTLALIEAMTIDLASRDTLRAYGSLQALEELRGSIDRNWLRRGRTRSK